MYRSEKRKEWRKRVEPITKNTRDILNNSFIYVEFKNEWCINRIRHFWRNNERF